MALLISNFVSAPLEPFNVYISSQRLILHGLRMVDVDLPSIVAVGSRA